MSDRFHEIRQVFDFIGKSDVLFSENEIIHVDSKMLTPQKA